MSGQQKILIAGCGDIGHRLAATLLQQGHEVVALKRSAQADALPSLRYLFCDLSEAKQLQRLDSDFDKVFFLAAAGDPAPEVYRKLYQQGLLNLLSHCSKQTSNPQWLFVSSTRVYGHSNGAWVDEESVTKPKNRPGQYLIAAEKAVLAENKHNLVVRFSGIYGPSRQRLIRIAKNEESIQCTPPYYTNRIHQEDCAAVLFFLFERMRKDLPMDRCYLASDDDPAAMHNVISWICGELEDKKIHCKPTDPEATRNKRCNSQRLKDLGFRFKYPTFREGYAEMLKAGLKPTFNIHTGSKR